MCGIFGIVSPGIDQGFLERATTTLAHRGPDDAGYYRDDHIGLGHRRLSIIDLSGGHQPIFNEDRTRAIICNGEIYNHEEIRERLLALGHRFSTRSDTEVVLHAYEEWGEDCVSQLRGMFAFAVWDGTSRTLFLGRDRLGIKPLFYSDRGRGFSFASEMKAILADESVPREIDELALAAYFNLSYIPGELTIYRGIRKLLPGHTLTLRDGKATIRKYWDLYPSPDYGKSEATFIAGFMDLLQEAVRIRLMSEVPLGAFLSGGVDSSTVVALMSQAPTAPVNTFCMGFGGDVGGYLDERGYARQVATRYGAQHREFEVQPEASGLVETIVRAFDEPFADDSVIPSYFVCKIARENVTVALSGLGGDEVFAGYERHLGFALSSKYAHLPGFLREGMVRPLVERLSERADGHYTVNHMKRFVRGAGLPPGERYFGFLNKMNPSLRDSFFTDRPRFVQHLDGCRDLVLGHFHSSNVDGPTDSLNRVLYCDLKTYLPEDILALTDRLSMHHALEVRVPFLDHKFLEYCSTIPPDLKMKWMRKKYLLKKAARPYLPAEVIDHRKQGFVGPMTRWLKNELKPFVLETLSPRNLGRHDLIDQSTVRRVLDEHFSGREIHDTLIWSMVIFQTWFNLYMGGGGQD
ncbi:asparagine synthase (glutamine-hydrolyzing) [Desulfuromonas sp. KJ2020]|uniref:asparagine synthase (glutamine-hydrolyzing) n=1 Tax=Desulfuromonas sp. KJ2020 TaxID=2919173 RepID=UPI0020A728B4|nr:asparagine synthase (glutamine-hydrolyzing) [Desulfuromonas sp. KJ2020]MCP3178128.1 asparagine synthase (glutamine-hydrolyzing) [Desulfuromonas sp. KJ2020]